ncbi:LysR family transcriptional regulator [Sodalis sp. RH21]|uniref:LysR family transcriptional regulator n=1 Tax=unclassified Sodalis (in: enterobacteria) TaxID=2636512 RepID=UPI0039B57B34
MILDKFLRQFIEVASFKNVSHAANKLCLSQPTLTHNMKKLEENMGVPLLERTSTGVKLTLYGDILLEQARMIQRIYDNTFIKMTALKERQEQSLRIGAGHAWWYMFVKDIFNLYSKRFTTANIHIDLGNHLWLMDLLLSSDIDLFIGHEIKGLNPKYGIHFFPLFSTVNGMYVRDTHPLLNSGLPLSGDSLLSFPYLEVTPDTVRQQSIVEDMQSKKYDRNQLHLTERVVYSTNSMMAAIDILNNSDSIMPYPACMDQYFYKHHIVPLRLDQHNRRDNVGAYIMRENIDAAHIVQLMDLIRQFVKQHLSVLENNHT